MAVKCKDDETVVSRGSPGRPGGMKKVMADPIIQPDKNPMPFDGKRLIYGALEMLIDA